MNIWKPVAIGCIGYIAGVNARRGYSGNYYRGKGASLKDDLMDILVGKFYYLVWGETREQTNDRRLDRRFGKPISYAPVYYRAGGEGSYFVPRNSTDYISRKHNEESEENEEEYDET